MLKTQHEFRDPIHTFIRLDSDERRVVDSEPVQRLRHVHQLAMSYLVYPGATHRRFEHALGVMELAGRIFDVVTHRENVHPVVWNLLPELHDEARLRSYWRCAVRMAGLCHDLGHLPFSHAAEHELLPAGWSHERLSVELILSPQMRTLWRGMKVDPLDIAKLAVGPEKLTGELFTTWEALLSEIIVGDAFGADRMDYLLRDSLHAGVAYGRFDHFRLADTVRILPVPGMQGESSLEPQLGVEQGGLRSAEALLLARYFMFNQVYFHPVRRIYDLHLQDFLSAWLSNGQFPVSVSRHLRMTDNEVLTAMARAARESGSKGHDPARRIFRREHFKLLWEHEATNLQTNPDAGDVIFGAAVAEFGNDTVRRSRFVPDPLPIDFPVLRRDDSIVSALTISEVLERLPTGAFDQIFVEPQQIEAARSWLDANQTAILAKVPTEE